LILGRQILRKVDGLNRCNEGRRMRSDDELDKLKKKEHTVKQIEKHKESKC
jgi:hypothetical protein